MSKKHVGDKPWKQHIQLGRRKPGQAAAAKGAPVETAKNKSRKPPGWLSRAAKAKQRRAEASAPPKPAKPLAIPAEKPAPSAPVAQVPRERPLDGEGRPYITLVQFLKTIDVVDTGGAGKHTIRAGGILVNGTEELRPARKLHAGDVVTVAGGEHRVTV